MIGSKDHAFSSNWLPIIFTPGGCFYPYQLVCEEIFVIPFPNDKVQQLFETFQTLGTIRTSSLHLLQIPAAKISPVVRNRKVAVPGIPNLSSWSTAPDSTARIFLLNTFTVSTTNILPLALRRTEYWRKKVGSPWLHVAAGEGCKCRVWEGCKCSHQ